MKKLMIGLVTLLTMGEGAMAQTVSVADVEAVPGETVSFSVDLSNGKADAYTALTFDVQFPAEGFTTTGTYAVSSSWSGATCVVGDVDASGLATVPFASADEIPGTEVENLVSVSFKVDESVAVGEYDVTLKNIMFEYGISDKDYAENVTFKVNVVASHAVVLDETSIVAPEAATGVKVIVRRTIKANEWSTICLPFAMTAAQCQAAFGDDVELGDFNDYVFDGETGTISVNFTDATEIEANHPYIIKVATGVSEFTVDGVDIDPQEAVVDFDTSRRKNQPRQFVGTYVANTTLDWGMLFLSGNNFWYSVGETKMKAYRGYFNFYDLLPDFENNNARIQMVFDGEATAIHAVDRTASTDDGYYNLAGQRVEQPGKGLYIKNNKKVIVK